jgi:hypothetical protein
MEQLKAIFSCIFYECQDSVIKFAQLQAQIPEVDQK